MNEPVPAAPQLSLKIWSRDSIETRLAAVRAQGLRVVHCHGVFDVLHPGHVDHLAEARALGDFLVVSVTTDSLVNKGPGRPIHGISLRMKMLASLQSVDAVFESTFLTAVGAIDAVCPDVYAKGPDYRDLESDVTGNIVLEKNAVESHGGTLHITTAPSLSSSRLINQLGLTHTPEAELWLKDFRAHYSESDISQALENIAALKVVVVGEMIVDEYVFCDALGKTSKEPVLAFLKGPQEVQVGGSLAIAKHLSGLGATTTLVTRVGKDAPGERADSAAEAANVRLVAQRSSAQQTIVKTRYLDQHTGAKVFETYDMTDQPAEGREDKSFADLLSAEIHSADVVLVADYGHGLMTETVLDSLANAPGLVAVNTQSNAGNRGYNSISRYPRVDIVSLNGGEISLELRRKHATVGELIPDLGDQTGARWVVVTEGAKGLALWNRDIGVVEMPAFTERIKDRVGAGDALFAMVSVLLASVAPIPIVGLLGNLAGAAMVSDLGNRYTLSTVDMLRHSTALMK